MVCIAVGIIIAHSRATTPDVSLEAESVGQTGNSTRCKDTQASGESYIQFGVTNCNADRLLKSFVLKTPTNNEIITGVKVLEVMDDPLFTATRVDFIIDGHDRAAIRSADWKYSWDTTDIPDGTTHSISAKAYNAGNTVIAITTDVSVKVKQPIVSNPPAVCNVSPQLVNSCRPWLGAFVNNYSLVGLRANIENHEKRIGRQLDMAHSYYPAGHIPLNVDDRYLISRGTIVYATYTPAVQWSQAGGSNATVNAQIDQAALNIKSVAPNKVMFGLNHEPENDVSNGTSCTTLKGSSGSPAEYRAMWRNVRNRFNAKGVTNVVWVMNYMGYSGWNCMVKDLWPGNDLVDWVMWDPYATSNADTWNKVVSPFYDWMLTNSDAHHAFTSKAWGLAEWGIAQSDQTHAFSFYQDAQAAITSPAYSRIKAYITFDAVGKWDTRISYTSNGILDMIEQNHYKSFASLPQLREVGQ